MTWSDWETSSFILTENMKTDGNWISGDGGNEGIHVSSTGNVGINQATTAATLDIMTSSVSGRESLIRAKVSDAGSAQFGLGNGTASSGQFRPAFFGYNPTSNYPLLFKSMTNPANGASGDPMFYFQAGTTTDDADPLNGTASTVSRDIIGVLNNGDNVFTLSSDGDIEADGDVTALSFTGDGSGLTGIAGDGNGLYSGSGEIATGTAATGDVIPSGFLGNRFYYAATGTASTYHSGFESLAGAGTGFALDHRVNTSGITVSASLSLKGAEGTATYGDNTLYWSDGTDYYGIKYESGKPFWRVGTASFVAMPDSLPPNDKSVWSADADGGNGQWNMLPKVLDHDFENNSTTVDSTLFTFDVVAGRTYSGTLKLWWTPVSGESIRINLSPSAGTISGDWMDTRQTVAVSADAAMVISDYAASGKSFTSIEYFFTATNTATITIGARKNATGTGFSHEFLAGSRLIVDSTEN